MDTYKGVIGNLHGDLGRTDVTELHAHRRRPISEWNRYDLETYLGLCYFDCDINLAMTESAKVGTYPHDMYSYRLRGETSEGPVNWCNVYRRGGLLHQTVPREQLSHSPSQSPVRRMGISGLYL